MKKSQTAREEITSTVGSTGVNNQLKPHLCRIYAFAHPCLCTVKIIRNYSHFGWSKSWSCWKKSNYLKQVYQTTISAWVQIEAMTVCLCKSHFTKVKQPSKMLIHRYDTQKRQCKGNANPLRQDCCVLCPIFYFLFFWIRHSSWGKMGKMTIYKFEWHHPSLFIGNDFEFWLRSSQLSLASSETDL